ncbi:MAG TPA: glycosyltransferase [Casimicrobiaceae bacterium]|nr:glycosyltransferase [Casimicrobiaceae bacterium]
MRIVHTEASLGWGGQEIRILTEAAGMIARGHSIEIACPREARIFAEAPRFGVPATALAIGRKRPRGVFALRRFIAERKVDAINAHSSTDAWLAALAARSLSRPPPIVRTRHISAPVPHDALTRWLYTKATAEIVTTGEAIRTQLIRDIGVEPSRVSSIPTGIDPGRFGPADRDEARRSLGLPSGVPLIGIVAALRSWKGHRILVEAMTLLAHRDAQLVIVGGGPQREALRTQIGALGLDNRVRLAGNQNDVAPWLAALDVFALPSYANEGVPQALLQAMLTALPCVTTDAGAIGEAAIPDHTAVVVAKENAVALAAGIDRVLGDPALAQRIAAAGRERVLSRFSLAAMLDRMEAVFQRAVDSYVRK